MEQVIRMIKINIDIPVFNSVKELDTEAQDLIQRAQQAALKAYAPYSEFQVGAAVLLEDGTSYAGNNQENIAYPVGICAERVALANAYLHAPQTPIKTIALGAFHQGKWKDKPISPCGMCRQVLLEAEQRQQNPIQLILFSEGKILIIKSAGDLLPVAFDCSTTF